MDTRQWSILKAMHASQGNPADELRLMGRRNSQCPVWQIVYSSTGQIFVFGGIRDEKSENNKEKVRKHRKDILAHPETGGDAR
eukprot:766997-Hanusia_phi.AAC.2